MTKIVAGKTYILKNKNNQIEDLGLKFGVPVKCINCIEEGKHLGVFFEGQKFFNVIKYNDRIIKVWFYPKILLEDSLEEVKTFFQEEFEI